MSGAASSAAVVRTARIATGDDDDEVDREHDRDHREDEQEDHPARLPPGRGLSREEIHGGLARRAAQVKRTFGASRFSGDSISSSCAAGS